MIALAPRFGQDYETGDEVRKAWSAGGEFRIVDPMHPNNGQLVNRTDLPGVTVLIRFSKLRKSVTIR